HGPEPDPAVCPGRAPAGGADHQHRRPASELPRLRTGHPGRGDRVAWLAATESEAAGYLAGTTAQRRDLGRLACPVDLARIQLRLHGPAGCGPDDHLLRIRGDPARVAPAAHRN